MTQILVPDTPKFCSELLKKLNLKSLVPVQLIKDAFIPVAQPVWAVRANSGKEVPLVTKHPKLQQHLLDVQKFSTVVSLPDGARLIMLEAGIVLEEQARQLINECQLQRFDIVPHSLKLSWDYFNAQQLVSAVVAQLSDCDPEARFGSTFETVGHIAHLNITDESPLMPYRFIIGSILCDKLAHVKLVIRKVGTITTQFRTFEMEVLAHNGKLDFETEVKENNCRFKFDYKKVYWNSRLGTEHKRLCDLIEPDTKATNLTSSLLPKLAVFDVFAGVGPFAVPLAKRGCIVFANDLNPQSHKYLNINAGLNKLQVAEFFDITQDKTIWTCNLDGREFLKNSIANVLPLLNGHKIHFIMNLPAIALEFLDAFQPFLASYESSTARQIMVHAHCFTTENEQEAVVQDLQTRINASLGQKAVKVLNTHLVRKVAPNKDMYCVSFRLSVELYDSSSIRKRKLQNDN